MRSDFLRDQQNAHRKIKVQEPQQSSISPISKLFFPSHLTNTETPKTIKTSHFHPTGKMSKAKRSYMGRVGPKRHRMLNIRRRHKKPSSGLYRYIGVTKEVQRQT